jgi:penicillin-binding protein A
MRSWIALAAAAVLVASIVPLVQHRASADEGRRAPAAPIAVAAQPAPHKPLEPPPLAGIDLAKLHIDPDEVTAPAASGRVAHLSIDPALQRTAQKILRSIEAPEASVVLEETATGRVLVWASHVQKGPERDLCGEATAPAASVFKIVTGAALVEYAGLNQEARQCYSGGETRIMPSDLIDDPRRDRWCATMSEAMGRSLNVVFARLALKNLSPEQLLAEADAFGFGDAVPFDVPVARTLVHIPDDRLGFARTAAGFWNSTLSPLEGAALASAIANRGEFLRPTIVDSVSDAGGVLYRAPARQVLRRAIKPETADILTEMMETTVSGGTSYRAFHDPEGNAFLPNIGVAGKTGTLTRSETRQFYTWFVGFAPSRTPEVAISALVVNGPKWRAKANVVAREILRAYFASRAAPGVTRPSPL